MTKKKKPQKNMWRKGTEHKDENVVLVRFDYTEDGHKVNQTEKLALGKQWMVARFKGIGWYFLG